MKLKNYCSQFDKDMPRVVILKGLRYDEVWEWNGWSVLLARPFLQQQGKQFFSPLPACMNTRKTFSHRCSPPFPLVQSRDWLTE